jgi:hypothetical protein
MALTPLKAGRGEGGGSFKEGKSRRHITVSTQRLHGVELGSGAVRGG